VAKLLCGQTPLDTQNPSSYTPAVKKEVPININQQLQAVFEQAAVGMVIVEAAQSRFVKVNRRFCEIMGYSAEELLQGSIHDITHPDDLHVDLDHVERISAGIARESSWEKRYRKKDGTVIWAMVFVTPLDPSEARPTMRLGVIEDITERKRAEEALRETNETLGTIIQSSPIAIIALDPDGNVTRWNPAAEQMFGWMESEVLGQFLPIVSEDKRDEHLKLRECVLRGEAFTNVEVRRRKKDGSPIDISVSTAPLRDSKFRVTGIMSVSTDITERKRTEKQLRESLEQLRRAVETTIQVLVMAVEMKDPYTAGHQRRMTNLARAVATEMGLPPEKIEGLRMAGVIHDIGKITLPTEILSKPTKLSAIEFSLLKEHVRLGYDILKDVESPWPLAEIVLQHHERMDGSGYPRGLKGEEILIEARILAVADVVEAMASHRPYRAALGLDAALEEIEKNRGLLYDSHVVNTCLRVFREKGYQIEGT
jgi:PAS domain S-box-containing protein